MDDSPVVHKSQHADDLIGGRDFLIAGAVVVIVSRNRREWLLPSNGQPVSGHTTLLDMLKQYAFGFCEVLTRLEWLWNAAEIRSHARMTSQPLDSHYKTGMQNCFKDMRKECEDLDLASTAALIGFMESEFKRKDEDYSYADLLTDTKTLRFSFINELGKRFFFRISDDKQKFFQKSDLFGPEVSKAFPSCADDITNAGSCYALEQWNACVFHSMTILGRGLDVMATKFGVPFTNATWHTIIEQIEVKVRQIGPAFGPDWKDQQKFYSQAATQFMFLRAAWRNHVMHGRDVYDEGTSLSILGHVRLVMQALAAGGLSE